MNARTLLIPRTLLILSLVVLSGAPCASAQSFKERLKNAAKKIEQKVKQEVAPKKLPEKSGNTSSLDSELQKRHDAMVGPDNRSSRNSRNILSTHRMGKEWMPKSSSSISTPAARAHGSSPKPNAKATTGACSVIVISTNGSGAT